MIQSRLIQQPRHSFFSRIRREGRGEGGKAAKIVAPVNICSFPSLSLSVEKGTCCDVGIPLPPPPAVRHRGSSNIDISQQGEEELEEGRG